MDAVEVTSSIQYRPIEEGWVFGSTPAFRVFTKNQAAARSILTRLEVVRMALASLWNVTLTEPLNVVVCDSSAAFTQWSGATSSSVDQSAKLVRTAAGLTLIVDGGSASVHRSVGRCYVLASLESHRMPKWLAEGLAQIMNTAEISGDRMTVGAVTIDAAANLNTEALRQLQQMAWSKTGAESLEPATIPPTTRGADRLLKPLGGGLANTLELGTSEFVPIMLNGFQATWKEVADYCDAELKRREETRWIAQPDKEFFTYFRDNPAPSLEKLFDPTSSDELDWRMGAWALTHYCLFGGDKKAQASLQQFVQALVHEPARAPIDVFSDVFGVKATKFEIWLDAYAENGRYKIPTYRLSESFQPSKPDFQALAESPVLQLKASTLVATQRMEEAKILLSQGYRHGPNRTPAYVRMLAELTIDQNQAQALKVLEEANEKSQLDTRSQRLLSRARLENLQNQKAGEPFTADEFKSVLQPLFRALNAGDQSEELFVMIGRAWTFSPVKPNNEHLNALRLGLKYHPKSETIAALLTRLEAAN